MATSDSATTRLITEYDVARAANIVVRANRPHFKYPDPVPVYVKNGAPSCIVACVLSVLDLPYTKLIENVPPSRQPDLGVVFTPDAAEMLDLFQELQDNLNEWEGVVADTYAVRFLRREDYFKSL